MALLVSCIVAIATPARPVHAHSPHDVVGEIQFAADYESSGSILAEIRGRLMASSDRGSSWTEVVNGLGGEIDPLRTFALASSDPDVGYAALVSGSALRTDDGGQNWIAIADPPAPAFGLRVSPRDPDVVIAWGADETVSRSTDGGRSWSELPVARTRLVDAAFVPDGTRIIGVDSRGTVLTSDDDGAGWEVAGSLDLTGAPTVVEIVHHDDDRLEVFVGSSDGELVRSRDAGRTFDTVGAGLPDEEIRSIGSSTGPAGERVLWATTWSAGPFRSTDVGATWTGWGNGTTTNAQADERRQPHWNTLATAPDGAGMVLLGGFDGLFLLDHPQASSWRAVETLDEYITGLAVSPGFTDDGVVIVMSYIRGAFRSEDGGDTWDLADGGLVYSDHDGNSFPVWRLHNVRFSPDFANDGIVFGATWNKMLRSTDRGRSWTLIDVPASPDGKKVRQFVIAVSPDFADDGTVYAGTRQGILYRSIARGAADTWEQISLVPEAIRSIAISPGFVDDGTMLIGTANRVYRSVNAGERWSEASTETAGTATSSGSGHGVQVAISPAYAQDRTALATRDDHLLLSHDGGVTWSRADALAGRRAGFVEAAAFSPDYGADGLILASVRGSGLQRSRDRGATFERVARGITEANVLIADYANPTSNAIQFSPTYSDDRTIFAYGQQAVLRSTDAGQTWEILELPSSDVVRVRLAAMRSEGRVGLTIWVLGALVAGLVTCGWWTTRRRGTWPTLRRRRRLRSASSGGTLP